MPTGISPMNRPLLVSSESSGKLHLHTANGARIDVDALFCYARRNAHKADAMDTVVKRPDRDALANR